jgi:hypothetical protein
VHPVTSPTHHPLSFVANRDSGATRSLPSDDGEAIWAGWFKLRWYRREMPFKSVTGAGSWLHLSQYSEGVSVSTRDLGLFLEVAHHIA